MKSPRETLMYLPAIRVGTASKKPDYLATVDVDPRSKTYGQVIHRLSMPNVGDELHHFGWNACSSCHAADDKMRRYIVLPGLFSSRIHIVDTAEPRAPKLHKVIEGADIAAKTNLSTPHTVHCLPDGQIMISMLGDKEGNGPGGFLLLDAGFQDRRPLGEERGGHELQLRFLVSAAAQRHGQQRMGGAEDRAAGFKLEDVKAGNYGHHLHFWDWSKRSIVQSARSWRERADPARSPLPPQPRQHARLRRRGAVEHASGTGTRPARSGKWTRSSKCRRSTSKAGRSRCRA